jgi:membrane associated rhomboid family serine protease
LIPLRDENPSGSVPHITLGLIGLNGALFVYELLLGGQLRDFMMQWGLVPERITLALRFGDEPLLPTVATLFTSMFLHGGWMHLIGNMVFFWVFGNNIEDAMGHTRFAIFYLICGVAAAAAQTYLNPTSPIPMVGASGAISGVLGAYLLLYPRVRVHALLPLGFYITTITLPAYVMLGYWILLQVLGSLPALGAQQSGGTAFLAHIGGFVAGLLLIRLFAKREYLEQRLVLPGGGGWR